MALIAGLSASLLVLWSAVIFRRSDMRLRQLSFQQPRDRETHVRPKRNFITLCICCTAGALTFVSPAFPVLVALLITAAPALKVIRSRRKRNNEIMRQLPTAISLFKLALDCGMNLYLSVGFVANHLDGPMALEFNRTHQQISNGVRTSKALTDLTQRTIPEVAALIDTLLAVERYGAPISVVLDRLEREGRTAQELRVERAVKRLSVQLLFPLAGCTLPAFALLTVAPFVAGSLEMSAISWQ